MEHRLFLFQLSVDHTVLKLGDFGLARATEGTRQTKTQIGSYRYMAPEVVSSGGHYSKKADVHSYGEEAISIYTSSELKIISKLHERLNECNLNEFSSLTSSVSPQLLDLSCNYI